VRPAQYHYSIEPRSPVLSQRGAPAYFTSSNSRVTELLRHLTSAPERHIDVERSEPVTPPPPQPPPALLEATTNAAWTTLIESAAAVAKPEVLTDAVERLAHTVDSIGERLRSTAPAPPPSETEPEIRWIADDELAGRLHAILKRQAHARGIDLS
jgi:hypothetical protein